MPMFWDCFFSSKANAIAAANVGPPPVHRPLSTLEAEWFAAWVITMPDRRLKPRGTYPDQVREWAARMLGRDS
jgi:hypothetical protein